MNLFLFASAPSQPPFVTLFAFGIWALAAVLAFAAVALTFLAWRFFAARPPFVFRGLRATFMLLCVMAAALLTEFVFLAMRGGSLSVRPNGESAFGFYMFQGAVTAVFWGIAFLLRQKLLTAPAPGVDGSAPGA